MKMQVIGQNMPLSAEEGEKFWPIYKHYADDLHEVHNAKYALLKQYAETWPTMSDQEALIYVRHWMEVDAQAQALRLAVCADGDPGFAGKKGRDVFSIGSTAVHDRRFAIVFADSVGPLEGGEAKRQSEISNEIPGSEKESLSPISGRLPLGNNPNVQCVVPAQPVATFSLRHLGFSLLPDRYLYLS